MKRSERDVLELLTELKEYQQKVVLKTAQRIIPHLTADDILQPNDFPELENHAAFRYEEGVLAGILTVEASLRSNLFPRA